MSTLKHKDSRPKDPLYYTPADLCDAFLRNPKARRHIDKISVVSAFYCKQRSNHGHEFILLRVADSGNSRTNFLLLDRTDPESNLARVNITVLSSGSSKLDAIEDRLLVSYYGDKQSLLVRCGLANHKVVEELDFTYTPAFLLYEVLFMASIISSKCRTNTVPQGEAYRFANTLWACMLSMASKVLLKRLNKDWRREIFHQFNIFELADILFDTRHHISMFHSALELRHRAVR